MSRKNFLLVPALVLVLGVGLVCFAQSRSEQIKRKADLVKQKAEQWVKEGRNPSSALSLMKAASQAFENHQPDKGEALIEQALAKLSASTTDAKKEPGSHLYANPERVEIAGYNEDAMEPCVSLDGKYLFFNGSNADDIPAHIHYAKRLPDGRFQYLGLVPGARSAHRDMAPSLDAHGNFYFTRLTDFEKTLKSIWVGKWKPIEVANTVSVPGDIAVGCKVEPLAGPSVVLNMDCGISPDGNTLIVSRARITQHAPGPSLSDLFMAVRDRNGQFNVSKKSDLLLKSVNTPALEYAPALSADGLELYYTQALTGEQFADAPADSSLFSTFVATRGSIDEPFGTPVRLAAVQGYAEAPSLTLDKSELYFHKKDGELFRIYRAHRVH